MTCLFATPISDNPAVKIHFPGRQPEKHASTHRPCPSGIDRELSELCDPSLR